MSSEAWSQLEQEVPVFALPNLVMFPRAVQFIHVFEPRYKQMMEDLVDQADEHRLIAMALLKPGYEAEYHTNPAAVHAMLCLCKAVRYEALPDGRYNMLVQGRARARIAVAHNDGPYRQAELEVLSGTGPIDDPDTAGQRRATLRAMLGRAPFDTFAGSDRFRKWLDSDLSLGDATDLLTFHLLPHEEAELRQTVLREIDVERRADRLVDHLDTLSRVLLAQRRPCQTWPPEPDSN